MAWERGAVRVVVVEWVDVKYCCVDKDWVGRDGPPHDPSAYAAKRLGAVICGVGG